MRPRKGTWRVQYDHKVIHSRPGSEGVRATVKGEAAGSQLMHSNLPPYEIDHWALALQTLRRARSVPLKYLVNAGAPGRCGDRLHRLNSISRGRARLLKSLPVVMVTIGR